MSDNEEDSVSANDRDTEESVNMLSWPDEIEEGMITAGAIREIEENEDRFSRYQHSEKGGSDRTDLISLLLVFGISAGVLLLLKLAGLF